MTLLSLSIPGEPIGKGRPKFARTGAFVTTRTPEKTASWEAGAATLLRDAWDGRAPLDEPVVLTVQAVCGRRKADIPGPRTLKKQPELARRQWRVTKPDGDNVLKCVGDVLVKAGVLRDDTRVVEWRIRCVSAALNEGPSVEIRLDTAPPMPSVAA